MKLFIVTYVGLSDSDYSANGYNECRPCETLEDARKTLQKFKESEIHCLNEEGRDFEILEDGEDECRIGWCANTEQIRIEIHETDL